MRTQKDFKLKLQRYVDATCLSEYSSGRRAEELGTYKAVLTSMLITLEIWYPEVLNHCYEKLSYMDNDINLNK